MRYPFSTLMTDGHFDFLNVSNDMEFNLSPKTVFSIAEELWLCEKSLSVLDYNLTISATLLPWIIFNKPIPSSTGQLLIFLMQIPLPNYLWQIPLPANSSRGWKPIFSTSLCSSIWVHLEICPFSWKHMTLVQAWPAMQIIKWGKWLLPQDILWIKLIGSIYWILFVK